MKNLPFRNIWSKVVITPGNHDLIFERWNEHEYERLRHLSEGRLIILRNKQYDFNYIDEISGEPKILKIWGTPYCQIFGNWAFMRPNSVLKEKFSLIPNDIDVLISHSSPDIEEYGCVRYNNKIYKNAGCPVLAAAIREKKPKYVFCGHIHSGDHTLQNIDGTMFANVSYVDENYIECDNMLKIYL